MLVLFPIPMCYSMLGVRCLHKFREHVWWHTQLQIFGSSFLSLPVLLFSDISCAFAKTGNTNCGQCFTYQKNRCFSVLQILDGWFTHIWKAPPWGLQWNIHWTICALLPENLSLLSPEAIILSPELTFEQAPRSKCNFPLLHKLHERLYINMPPLSSPSTGPHFFQLVWMILRT